MFAQPVDFISSWEKVLNRGAGQVILGVYVFLSETIDRGELMDIVTTSSDRRNLKAWGICFAWQQNYSDIVSGA